EGWTTLTASIAAASNDPALVATIPVQVLPLAVYKLKKVVSTEQTASTSTGVFSALSAVSASEVAGITTLANGNQAAILMEGAKLTPLAVVGQVLPNAGRMVLRIDGISANSKGDVALLIEYPSQWCSATVILFPHGKPEQEIGAANCNNGLYSASLAENDSI